MQGFEALLSSINGRVIQNRERITAISGSLKVGGWIAKWGSWQIFKHDISNKCNVIRGVAVSVDESTPMCMHENSTVCILQISGSSCIKIDEEEQTIYSRDVVSVHPGSRFTVNPLEGGSEFILILVPPTPLFDTLMNASSLHDVLGVCGEDSDRY